MDPVILDPKLLDRILATFTTIFTLNWTLLTNEALALLGSLATIALVIIAFGWYLSHDDGFSNALFILAQYLLLVVMISNLQWIVEQFTNSFVQFGSMAGGGTIVNLNMPSTIFLAGQQVTTPILVYVEGMRGFWSTTINSINLLIFLVMLLVIWACFWFMSIHVMCAVVELQLWTVMSLLLIPWAAVGATSFIASSAFARLFSSMVYLGLLALVTGITVPIFVLLAQDVKVPTYNIGALMMFGALTLAVLHWKVPNMAGHNTFTAQSFAALGSAVTYGVTRAMRMI